MMDNRRKVDDELLINIKTHNKVFKKLDNLLSQTDIRKWIQKKYIIVMNVMQKCQRNIMIVMMVYVLIVIGNI